MHKKLLLGFGTLALGLALLAPAAQAGTHQGTQIAQADTGAEKAPATKKKSHKKKSHKKKHGAEAGTKGKEAQPQ
jgi:hypothetical protein